MEGVVFLVIAFAVVYFLIKKSANKGLTAMQKYEMTQAQKKSFESNPYINYHKQKLENDKNYKEYLDWMQKNNIPGAPSDKLTSPEDAVADKKIKRLFN